MNNKAACLTKNQLALMNQIEAGLQSILGITPNLVSAEKPTLATNSSSTFQPTNNMDSRGENENIIAKGSATQIYSLALKLEADGDVKMANRAYQAIVQKYPDSPLATKAIERQEKLAK
jgi:TolA-binding protein